MTYDELLTRITIVGDTSIEEALRAVVELHKPEHSIRGYCCKFEGDIYPCTTIQAIEKELANG